MLSCITLASSEGRILAIRDYRGDVDRETQQEFCNSVIRSREGENNPIVRRGANTFFFVRENDVYVITVTRHNANAAMCIEFLNQAVKVLKSYFGGHVTVTKVRDSYTLIYAIMDEVMDYGYPQILAPEILKEYILEKGMPEDVKALIALRERQKNITLDVTGAVAWRKRGIIYKKNELFLDAVEKVTALLTSSGDLLFGEVSGAIKMKAQLSGMPECKLGLNDKLQMEEGGGGAAAAKPVAGNVGAKRQVALDSMKFHQCVRLRHFDANKEIVFIPPDGEFELVTYRMTDNIRLPFKVVPVFTQHGRTRASLNVIVKSEFMEDLTAYDVSVIIPVPKTTSGAETTITGGKYKFDNAKANFTWKIPEFAGATEYKFSTELKMVSTLTDKQWEKPPIKLKFNIPMFTSTGLRVRFLKVFEKSANYSPTKWVRYLTLSGNYEVRI